MGLDFGNKKQRISAGLSAEQAGLIGVGSLLAAIVVGILIGKYVL